MEGITQNLTHYLGDLGSIIRGTVLVLVVILLLSLMNRILEKHLAQAKGSKFRNQLLMFGASFVGLLMIILGLPIDPNTRGQLLSLIGIIVSAAIALSSSTFIGNAMAGIMLKTVRNFRTGDFVKTDDVFGRVTERGLFHTEIQTPDRDLTTVPNLYLATKPVTVVRQSGTIIGATVSLGYDVHHTQIEELLLGTASAIGLQDPFVQVLELGDYSIVYRVAGLLTETKQLIAYRSRLRSGMLDALHKGGVEIVSPQFNNARMLGTDQIFIPKPTRQKSTPSADAAPVDVAFDKAEEAEDLDSRQRSLTKMVDSLKELQKEAKAAPAEEKPGLETRIGHLEKEIEDLKAAISSVEEKDNKEKD